MPPRASNRDATAELDLGAGGSAPGSNLPELSVSELAGALKKTVEERFGLVRLRGEVSNYRGPHSSGHAYFSLKDVGARIDAVMWRTAFAKLRIKPEEGMEVVASGKITTFPGKSSYQIVIETLEPAGVGALMAILEERRLRLAGEGLFDTARKRPLPYLPGVIGVVTSPTGAVIRDILHRLAGRFPRHVTLWPVRVQGETSGAEVAAAIRGLNALGAGGFGRRPHVIIVARGGGSLEDLWGFNDEAVVRAVADSDIPLISAVGHETDWTLIDHVADLRAPTPTGAAEMAVPVLFDLTTALDRLRLRQRIAAVQVLDRRRTDLRALLRHLPASAEVTALPRQALDRAAARLPAAIRTRQDRARLDLARLGGRLAAQSPHATMARQVQKVIALRDRLARAGQRGLAERRGTVGHQRARLATAFAARIRLLRSRQAADRLRLEAVSLRLHRTGRNVAAAHGPRLDALAQLLRTLGYRSVLARGYALVRDLDGHAVRSAEVLRRAAGATVELADGLVEVQPRLDAASEERGSRASRPARPRPREAGSTVIQPSLFER